MTSYRLNQVHRAFQGDDKDAPLFVLLHGFGASIFSWRLVMDDLSKLGEVWAYDRPGFGYTERPTSWVGMNPYSVAGQLELLEQRILELKKSRPVIVIGHSAGGQIATYFAATHPLLVQGVVLISPAMVGAGVPEPFDKLFRSKFFDFVGPKLMKQSEKAGLKLLFASVHNQSYLTEDVIAGYLEPLRTEDWTRGFWEFVRTAQPRDQQAAIAKTYCPTLILTGDDDRVIPTKQTIAIAKKYPNSRLVLIEAAGHISHEEKHDEVMDAVRHNLPWLLGKE